MKTRNLRTSTIALSAALAFTSISTALPATAKNDPNIAATSNCGVKIIGAPEVGGTLKLEISDQFRSEHKNARLLYKWLRYNNKGQTELITKYTTDWETYPVTDANIDKKIYVAVWTDPTNEGGTEVCKTNKTKVVPKSDLKSFYGGQVKITGTAKPGNKLTAQITEFQPEPTKNLTTYQWLKDDKPIKGQTHQTYQIQPTDTNHNIKVRATITKTGYAPKTMTSQPKTVKTTSKELFQKIGNKCVVPANVVAVAVTPECPAGSVKWETETTKETTPTNAVPKNNPLTDPKATKAQIITYLKPVCNLKYVDKDFYLCEVVKSETGEQNYIWANFRAEDRAENGGGYPGSFDFKRGQSLTHVNSLANSLTKLEAGPDPSRLNILVSSSQVEIGYGYENGIPAGLRKLLPSNGLQYWISVLLDSEVG